MKSIDINNFAVKVTDENKDIIQKWFEEEFPGDRRIFSVNAHFGKQDGKALGRSPNAGTEGREVITFEEFQTYILNKTPIYEIY